MAVGYAYALLGDFHLAEDAAQEAFIEAYSCLAELRSPYAFPGWLRRIVFKQCDRITRRQQPTLMDPLEKNQTPTHLHNAISALPPPERQATALYYFSGMDHKAIAAFLYLAPHTINNRLRAGRRRLKQRMLAMLEDNLHSHRPSKDEHFAATVDLFIALHAGQTERVRMLLDKMPDISSRAKRFIRNVLVE
jgi:RNA polymerase sigma factor (sigma-70 family)